MYYEKNLQFIESRFPYLIKELAEDEAAEPVELEVTRSKTGLPVARVGKDGRKVYLNSVYDPELEARRWAAKLAGEERSCLVICGWGFLYHLQEIIKNSSFKKVVLYEPSKTVFKACMHEIDLGEVLAGFLCLLTVGKNYMDILGLIDGFLTNAASDCRIETIPAYTEVFGTEISAFQKIFQEMLRMAHINLATSESYSENWILSGIKALPQIVRSPGVRHFFNRFSGIPAVCVAAGPSLEKNIALLADIKEKAVILCAGSTIRAMLRNNILPHFLLSFDDGAINCEIYNDPRLKDIHLVYSHRLYFDVVRQYPGPKIYMKIDVEKFTDMITYKSGGYEFGTVLSGFSIAHTSLDFAFRLGCNPLILIGQDLAYTSNKRYADGQLDSLQQQCEGFNLPPGGFVTKDIYGQEIITDQIFDSFRRLFVRRIEDEYQGKVKVINATEGGVPIEGAENRRLAEVIAEYCQNNQGISNKIKYLYRKGQNELDKLGPKALCIPWQIEELMQKGIRRMAEIIDQLQALRKSNFTQAYEPERLERELQRILDEYHNALKYKEYDILVRDLVGGKIQAVLCQIEKLEPVDTPEKFDRKLQYWENIMFQTKIHLEHIREANQESVKTGDNLNGKKLETVQSNHPTR